MKLMFSVLGEGRGHMTQAIAVKEMAEKAGHRVTHVVLGAGPHREIPSYFASAIQAPITRIATTDFACKNARKISLPATLASAVRQIPAYCRSLRALDNLVREVQPDVIVNFFEPLTGFYALTKQRRPPVVAVAHQFMFEHPAYVRLPGRRGEQFGMKWFFRLVGAASTRVALSLYEAPDLPEKNIIVAPPFFGVSYSNCRRPPIATLSWSICSITVTPNKSLIGTKKIPPPPSTVSTTSRTRRRNSVMMTLSRFIVSTAKNSCA